MATRSEYYKAVRQVQRWERKGEITEAASKEYQAKIRAHFLDSLRLRRQYEAGKAAWAAKAAQ